MQNRALITGITGQDGAYLARLLLSLGYQVWGTHRRSSSPNTWRLRELGILEKIRFIPMDLLEYSNIQRVIETVRPNEVYNLAAQSFVQTSFEMPLYTGDVDGLGVTRILEAVRTVDSTIHFYQASTSELFGKVHAIPQNEATPFHPRSPYGVGKLYAHWITVNYRESYGMHTSCGILFNHESPLRGQEFVTRKVTTQLAKVIAGKQRILEVGNLEARRDWGFAGDYVDGMWRMLQRSHGDDFVLATGETHSVREFIDEASRHAGHEIEWDGVGALAVGRSRKTGQELVRVNPEFYRPAEVDLLIGDPAKATQELGWKASTRFKSLVEMMMTADMRRVAEGTLEA